MLAALLLTTCVVGGCRSPAASQPMTAEERRHVEELLDRVLFEFLINMMDDTDLSEKAMAHLLADPGAVLESHPGSTRLNESEYEPLVELLRLARAEAVARRAATQPATRPTTVPHDLLRHLRDSLSTPQRGSVRVGG